MASVLVISLVLSLFCWSVLAGTQRNWTAFWEYRNLFLKGWLSTLQLAGMSLIVSSIFGILAALAIRSVILPIRHLALFYVELIRGLPFLVLILLLFYGPAEVTRNVERFTFGVFILSFFSGAYIAEMVRAGIESISSSQWESARAIGLTKWQTYRFVVFPQAIRQILPPLAGQFASLIKDSSLLSVIGVAEFTQSAQQAFSATYSGLESFLPLGVGYLILTLPVLFLSRYLQNLLRYEH